MHPDTARSPCQAAYDRAHAALAGAACLVWDTETSGFAGCVLDIGWVLADSSGAELASYIASFGAFLLGSVSTHRPIENTRFQLPLSLIKVLGVDPNMKPEAAP